jgi:hypothetical protein
MKARKDVPACVLEISEILQECTKISLLKHAVQKKLQISFYEINM